MQIRLFQPEDTLAIAQLFHDTVRAINIQDYSLEQVKAWSPDDLYFRNWLKSCSSKFTYVAEVDQKIVGFGELEPNGQIDCFYCHHLYQRQGVGNRIYAAIAKKAQELNLTHLFTEASITAKPFFLSKGFVIVKKQTVFCRGQVFVNYLMIKELKKQLCQDK